MTNLTMHNEIFSRFRFLAVFLGSITLLSNAACSGNDENSTSSSSSTVSGSGSASGAGGANGTGGAGGANGTGGAGGADGTGGAGGAGGAGGSTSASCASLEAALTQALDKARENVGAPGAVLAVNTPNCGLWIGASGQSTPEDALRTDHILRAGSVTKTYVAAVLTDLAVAGELSLDDMLSTWVPSFPGGDQITVRQVLNHSSGIFNYTSSQTFLQAAFANPGKVWTPAELVDIATSEPPYFAPGQGWHYSNTNYILAGLILESVTGKAVVDVLHERLFTPLSLTSTFLDGEEMITGDLAHGYQGSQDVTSLLHPSSAWAAGAVAANVTDLVHWTGALYGGTAIAPAALTEMLANPVEAGPGLTYGLGTMLLDSSLLAEPAVGHSGSFPGFASWVLYQPERQVAIATMINDSSKEALPIVAAALQVVVAQ